MDAGLSAGVTVGVLFSDTGEDVATGGVCPVLLRILLISLPASQIKTQNKRTALNINTILNVLFFLFLY
jgi:hypothetical protein